MNIARRFCPTSRATALDVPAARGAPSAGETPARRPVQRFNPQHDHIGKAARLPPHPHPPRHPQRCPGPAVPNWSMLRRYPMSVRPSRSSTRCFSAGNESGVSGTAPAAPGPAGFHGGRLATGKAEPRGRTRGSGSPRRGGPGTLTVDVLDQAGRAGHVVHGAAPPAAEAPPCAGAAAAPEPPAPGGAHPPLAF